VASVSPRIIAQPGTPATASTPVLDVLRNCLRVIRAIGRLLDEPPVK